jgi:hypothetical protein
MLGRIILTSPGFERLSIDFNFGRNLVLKVCSYNLSLKHPQQLSPVVGILGF